jgi:hypothetical protein
MVSDRIVLCGGLPSPVSAAGQKTITLQIAGPSKNVNLRVSDISKKTVANLPDLLVDLVEIAAYVYCADQATARGGEGVLDVGAKWRRNFQFFILAGMKSLNAQCLLLLLARGEVCFKIDTADGRRAVRWRRR